MVLQMACHVLSACQMYEYGIDFILVTVTVSIIRHWWSSQWVCKTF